MVINNAEKRLKTSPGSSSSRAFAAGGGCFDNSGDNSLFVLFIPTSIVSDHNNTKMPLDDDGQAWKTKTTDVKDHYDFKKVLGM